VFAEDEPTGTIVNFNDEEERCQPSIAHAKLIHRPADSFFHRRQQIGQNLIFFLNSSAALLSITPAHN
jgi:hypothetical protein